MQQHMECKDAIRRMCLSSKSFKSICHSYQKCSEAIRYWTESDRDEAPERQREYTALLHELELEIMQSLKEGFGNSQIKGFDNNSELGIENLLMNWRSSN